MRLWTYLTLIVNSVIFLAFLAYGAWSAHTQSQQRSLEIQIDTQNIVTSLVAAAADDVLAENLDKLENLLARTVTIANLQHLTIADAQGNVLAQVKRDEHGKSKLLYGSHKLALSDTERLDEQNYTYTRPINRGTRIAWVSATSSLQPLSQLRQQIWWESIAAGALLSLLTSAVLLFKLRRDTRALANASRFATQLAEQHQGQLTINSPIHELQQLQQALNNTSRLLQQQFYDLDMMDAQQKRINDLLQMSINDLAAKQFALDQHAIVSITDLQGVIVYVNEKFTEISQYSSEELLGHNHRIIKSGQHDAAFYEEMWQTISNGKVWHGEVVNRRKDGGLYWVASTIVPLLDMNGLPNQYIAIRTDISYRKRTEQQLSANQGFLKSLMEKYRDAEQQISAARKRELDIGSQIQHTLLFGEIPSKLENVSLAVYTEASKGIDGDFYQFQHFPEQGFDLSIGDVMGKGIPAALIGAAVKQQMNQVVTSLLAKQREKLPDPEQIIQNLHQQITPRLIQLDSFVTLIYLHYDFASQQISYVDAGHTASLHARSDGSISTLSGINLPIGVMEDEIYQQQTCQLHAGDLLFLYSDGITEARNTEGEEFGIDRLTTLVQTLRTVPANIALQAVRHHLRKFEHHTELRDDRSCVVIQLGDNADCFDLSWDLSSLTILRHAIEQQNALPSEAQDALILASIESLTNIIRHSPKSLPDATIHCRIEPHQNGTAVNFYYLGQAYEAENHTPDFSGESEGGFGLFIIQSSVDYWHSQNIGHEVCWTRLEKWGDL